MTKWPDSKFMSDGSACGGCKLANQDFISEGNTVVFIGILRVKDPPMRTTTA